MLCLIFCVIYCNLHYRNRHYSKEVLVKFYDREVELRLLRKIKSMSLDYSKMTTIVGRRRIGKTRLILEAIKDELYVYFFVSRKSEALLCAEFVEEIKARLKIPIFGEIKSFKDIFALLLEFSRNHPLTVVIDEFQDFYFINPSVYSSIQHLWDLNKDSSKMHLILCGSIYTLMKKIFEQSKQPLFGRTDKRIMLKPFLPEILARILRDFDSFSPENLLSFYIITGGIAKYVELMTNERAFSLSDMLDVILDENSLFLDEGKNLLIEEFGKEYATYFSILSLISSSRTSRREIESVLQKNIGGYLERLENEYHLITRIKPILAKPASRNQKYVLEDNFLNFWFRFIYKYRSTIEIGNFNYVKKVIKRDFSTFAGKFLEKMFIHFLASSNKYTDIGSYWERGNQNEIDIVAINKETKKVLLAEVKLRSEKLNTRILPVKARKLFSLLKDYEFEFKGFSLEDVPLFVDSACKKSQPGKYSLRGQANR